MANTLGPGVGGKRHKNEKAFTMGVCKDTGVRIKLHGPSEA